METQSQTPPQQSAPVPPAVPPGPQAPKSPNTGMAILAYLGILIIIPFLTDAKNDPFVKFHLKQGLVMLILYIVGSFIFWVPVVGWLLWIACLILMAIGISNAASGKEKELPIVGKFGSSFNI